MISPSHPNAALFQVIGLALGPFQTNCFIAYPAGHTNALVIDPAAESEVILSELESRGLTLDTVVLTHGHFDHTGAVAELAAQGVPIMIHAEDALMLSEPEVSGAAIFGYPQDTCQPTQLLTEGDVIDIWEGALTFRVIHTPGHSPGSICLLTEKAAFVGDLLFAGGIGRSDLPGGNEYTIEASLKRLMELPDETLVYPGHGQITTIGQERTSNPFIP